MAKFDKKQRVFSLRKEGKSLKEISQILDISKSTASIWCQNISLNDKQKKALDFKIKIGSMNGRLKGAATNHRRKEDVIHKLEEQGRKDLGTLSRREFLIAGIALYWAEGSKKSKMGFVNSDPDFILFVKKWLKEIMNIKDGDLMPRIFINESHSFRKQNVLNFWSHLLGLPTEQFGNVILLKHKQKKVYDNQEEYHGVIALGVRNSSSLKYRILGLIKALKATMYN